MPHDFIACFTEGDRVTVHFAGRWKWSAKVTLAEATALLVALRALPPPRGAPEAKAVAGLIRKVEAALGPRQVKELARRISARRAPVGHGDKMRLLHRALDESRVVEIEYYTQRRRALSERQVRPYAIIDHLGNFYLIGRGSSRGRELSFRVDRIRSVTLTDQTFDKPRNFNAQRYRRSDFYRPGPSDKKVRIRVQPSVARYVRETRPTSEIKERSDGGLECGLRTDSLRWSVDYALQHGDAAEIVGPAPARAETCQVLDDWLAFYEANRK
jgi:proteasome accessory factor C